MPESRNAYILLGGNLGPPEALFRQAISMLGERIGQVMGESSLYETDPWGMKTERHFYNQAVWLLVRSNPTIIMKKIIGIERKMGRRRTPGIMEDRLIDIDILMIDDLVISEPGLEVPHPRMHLRRFALQPLAEIAPNLLHPVLNMRVSDLLSTCKDPLSVRMVTAMPAGINLRANEQI